MGEVSETVESCLHTLERKIVPGLAGLYLVEVCRCGSKGSSSLMGQNIVNQEQLEKVISMAQAAKEAEIMLVISPDTVLSLADCLQAAIELVAIREKQLQEELESKGDSNINLQYPDQERS